VVLDLVGFLVGLVDGTNQHVVGDVVKVTTVLQPGTGHGDVVGGGLALGLDEDGHVLGVLAIPRLERSKDLETVGGRGDIDTDAGTVLGGSLVSVLARVVASGRETVTSGRSKLELLAVLVLQGIGKRVEVEGSGDGHGDNQIGRGDERVSGGVTVVSAGEVTVVRRDDRVGLTLLYITSVPLTNARTASVGKDDTAELLEGLELTVTLNGGTDLLRTRGDSEGRLGLDTMVEGITSDRGGTGHILVRGVGARTNQTDLELLGPAILLDSLAELGDRSSQIRSEGTVDVGLELGEVDLNELVVLDVLVGAKAVGVGAGEVTNLLSLGGSKVVVHTVVEGEDGGSGTNLSTHVADSSHTSARNSIGSRAVVLDDGTSATLDSEDISDLEDNVLGGSPAVELTSQLNTNDVGGLELPVKVGHDIDSISTTNTNGGHTETTTVDSVRVSTNKKTTGETVVLEKNLVNNTGTGLPETDVVLGTSTRKEVVDLLVDVNSASKILLTTDLSLDQVVTVNGGRVGNLVHASGHELKDSHLSGSILASNTVRSQLEVARTTLDILAMGISQMRVQNLLSIGQRSVQTRADDVKVLGHLLVVDEVTLLPVVLADLYN
jgi:hypothetical protein